MAQSKGRVFAVFGLGSFGRTMAAVLAKRGGTVIAIDNKAESVDAIKNKVSTALLIDSTDERAMAKAPLEDVDTAVIAIEEMEANIITSVLVKDRGIPYIIGRAMSPIHAQVLRKIGINEVINLQEDEGTRIAQRLITPEIRETVPLTGDTSMTEFYVPELFVGKTVQSLSLRDKFTLHLAGIKHTDVSIDSEGNPVRTERLLFPDTEEPLAAGDILILVGKNYDIEQFKESV